MIKRLLLPLLPLFLMGCVTRYADASGDAVASVRFERGYQTGANQAGAGSFTIQEYWIFDDVGNPQRAGLFTSVNHDPVARLVQSGRGLRVRANTTYSQVTGVNNLGGGYSASTAAQQCVAEATFAPVAGHTYTVIQAELSYARCELRVIDLATGVSPPDVQVADHDTVRP